MKYSVIFIAILLALVTRLLIVSVYKVPTSAMSPLLRTGDYILASQISYQFKTPFQSEASMVTPPKKGELIVFIKSAKTLIRRVMAVPGETVVYVGGALTINGQTCGYRVGTEYLEAALSEVVESCAGAEHTILLPMGDAQKPPDLPETKLEAGKYLVLSENRSTENNAHVVEVVNSDQIIGKPLFIWMSYFSTQDFISGQKGLQWNRILTKLK